MTTPHWVEIFEGDQKHRPLARVAHYDQDRDLRYSGHVHSYHERYKDEVQNGHFMDYNAPPNNHISTRPLPAIPLENRKQESMKDRPLPPTPKQHEPPNKAKVQKQTSSGSNRRRRSSKTKRTNPRANSYGEDREISETSVTFTIQEPEQTFPYYRKDSCQNERTYSQKSRDNQKPREALRTKSNRISSSTSEDSTNSKQSKSDLLKSLPRKRRRRTVCLLPMLVVIVLILSGLFAAIYFSFFIENQEETAKSRQGVDMLIGKVELRLLNISYHEDMADNSSHKFSSIKVPLCQEMHGVFLQSNFSELYYGCDVITLKSGSVRVYEILVFKDAPELRNPFLIQSLLKSSSPIFAWNGLKIINLGEFLIDYDSIFVRLEKERYVHLPIKPVLKTTEFGYPGEEIIKGVISAPQQIPEATSPASEYSTGASTESETSQSDNISPHYSTPSSTSINSLHMTTQTLPPIVAVDTKESSKTTHIPEITTVDQLNGDVFIPATTLAPLQSSDSRPYIVMANKGSTASATSVAILCSLYNAVELTHFTVRLIRAGNQEVNVLNITADGKVSFPTSAKRYSNRAIVKLLLKPSSVTVSLNFTHLHCQDEGTYTCTAYGRDMKVSGQGYLYVRASPTKPVMTLPENLVENQEITSPFTCQANLGYPAGELRWLLKPKGHSKFLMLEVPPPTTSGECNNIATSNFTLTPSLEGNGSTIMCAVINSKVKLDKTYSTSDVLKVLPESVCTGRQMSSVVPHPYQCDKYIVCQNSRINSVKQCQDELCFNPRTLSCGQTGLIMKNSLAFMNEGVASMSCRLLHLGKWTSMTVWKILPTGKRMKILIAKNDSKIHVVDSEISDRVLGSVRAMKYEAILTFWIYSLTCEDEAMYACDPDVPFTLYEEYGQLLLRVKPTVPKISSPTEVVSGRILREKFVCEGTVGYPGGKMEWEVKYKDHQTFEKLSKKIFNITATKNTENCSASMKLELSFLPDIAFDGVILKCVSRNEASLPKGQSLWQSIKLQVIPNNFCEGHGTGPKSHPHTCKQYIQCSEGYFYVQKCSLGLCFNPKTLQCDIREPTVSVPFNANFPCRPNKNGVYFPHPYLCNRYIWCVQGRERTQNCPPGTLYLTNGQCTFNTNQSNCYKNKG